MKNWFRKAQLLPRRGTSFERRIIIIEMNYFEKKMKKGWENRCIVARILEIPSYEILK